MPSEESIVPRKGESFPFINITPGSATKSSHSRLLIRSHVGSWVWQKTKQTSELSDTDEVDDYHSQDVKRSMHGTDSNSIQIEAVTSTSLSASLTIGYQTPDLATSQTPSGGHDDNGRDLPRNNNAPELSDIGVSTLDPFQTHLSDNLPPAFVNWCTKYC
jgi:hypothetical protein